MSESTEEKEKSSEEILTIDIVENRVNYGHYIARLPTGPNDKCRSFNVIQKIYRPDGTEVKRFYRCTRCDTYMMVNAGNGTAPLNRHAEVNCSALSQAEREAARAKRLGHNQKEESSEVKSSENDSNDDNRDVGNNNENAARSIDGTVEKKFSISPSEMAMALAKSGDFCFRFGRHDADFFKKMLQRNDNKWSLDLLDRASQERAQNAQPSSVMVRLDRIPHVSVTQSVSTAIRHSSGTTPNTIPAVEAMEIAPINIDLTSPSRERQKSPISDRAKRHQKRDSMKSQKPPTKKTK